MRATGFVTSTIVLGLVLTGSLAAQQPAAPKDATGQCTDSSYTTAKTQARACLKHGGVKTWFGGSASAAATAAAPTAAPTASSSASAKTTADKSPPKDATGQCTDGSYTTAKTQARACLKHGGVKTWSGGSESALATPAATTAAAPEPAASASAATTSAADKAQPKDATGQCTDGSYTTAKTQARGCLKHGGVKTWFGGAEASAASPAAPAPAPAPTAPTVVKATASPARATAPGATPAQAPTNPTDVWVNLSTKAYHCPGTKWYGTTKHGKYMSEADAKAAGFHPSYGKACS